MFLTSKGDILTSKGDFLSSKSATAAKSRHKRRGTNKGKKREQKLKLKKMEATLMP